MPTDLRSVEVATSYNELLPIAAALVENMLDVGGGRVGGTVFDGTSQAGIGVGQYLARLVKYGKCSKEIFIVILVYLDRFTAATNRGLTTHNIHRLLLATFTAAVKLRDDTFYPNSYYAEVGGVATADLNVMEQQLLTALDWDLHVSYGEYLQYVETLRGVRRRREANRRAVRK